MNSLFLLILYPLYLFLLAKEAIWSRRHYGVEMDKMKYIFRLLDGEVFFHDKQTM
jgi:hypothetical protein